MHTTFKVNTIEFNKALKEYQKLNKRFFEKGSAKIRVMPAGIEISGEGIYKTINGETEGLCEAFVPLKLLYSYSSLSKSKEISFSISEGELRCGSSIFAIPSIKIESLYHSDDLGLSINSDDYELLKEFYTKGKDYMEKHNLYERTENAKKNMNKCIEEACFSLEKFKVSKSDILNLIIAKFSQ